MAEDLPADAEITKQEREANFTEMGRTGLEHYGGRVQEEFLNSLDGDQSLKVFKEMRDNDPIVGAALLAIEQVTKQADWHVEPADDTPQDREVAEFVESNLNDMDRPWKQFISDALSMVVFGWSYFEVVYKRRERNPFDPINGSKFDDGRIGWKKLAPRSQDSLLEWKFDDNGNVTAMVQQPPPHFNRVDLPIDKSLHFRVAGHKNNPEGKSALRNAYRPWFFKKRLEEIEAIGIERDLNGIPVFWVPQRILTPDATDDEKATLNRIETMLENVRQDKSGGLILPAVFDESNNKLFDFELMSTRGRRSHDTSAIIMRYNRAIAASMLADFILIGHENVGSFALASSKTRLFSTAIGAYLDEIANTINIWEIPRLIRYNGWDVDPPKLVHSDVETIDLDDLAQYVTSLSRDAGLDLSGEQIQSYLKDQAGMPADGPHDKNKPEDGSKAGEPTQRTGSG